MKIDISELGNEKMIEYLSDVWFEPMSKVILDKPNIKNVVVAIGQYWNDEADDGCHISFLALNDEYSSWENCFKDDDQISDKNYNMIRAAEKEVFGKEYGAPYLDNDEDFIRVFSRFAKKGCDQEMGIEEAYSPLFIFSKNEDGSIRKRFLGDLQLLLK
jgi:hypothetical protein